MNARLRLAFAGETARRTSRFPTLHHGLVGP
jgi:hypothetical protein